MNNPIINPWLIYLINIINNTSEIAFIGMILTIMALTTGIIIYLIWRNVEYSQYNEDDVNFNKKAVLSLKRIGIALIIFVLLSLVIPTKETMYTMLVMKYITVENINGGVETVKAAVDYVFEKIDELNGLEDDK